jgi:hypothetical protein
MKNSHSPFYLIITILMLLVVFLGFGQSFFLRPLFEQPVFLKKMPAVVYVHGAIMTIWYVLLVVQSALVNVKKVKLHMTLGWGLVVCAGLIIISGLIVNAGVFPRWLALGMVDPNNEGMMSMFAFFWTYDQLAFLPFGLMVATAVYQRKNIALHRSMMLGASMLLLNPALFRMTGWMFPGFVMPSATLLYLLFPILLIAHDWHKHKKFPIYPFIGFLAIAVVTFLVIWLPSTSYWMEVFKKSINL